MNSLKNRVQLIGYLGADPEVRTVENGNKLARLRLATTETYTNARGEKVTETYWHQVVAWGKTAEIAEKLLSKGQEAVIEGKLVNRSYIGKDGQKKYVTEVVAEELKALPRKEKAE